MERKDLFSEQSKAYAAFRPTYPEELYSFIFQYLKHYENAWDCATGSGQVAQYLGNFFEQVFATDISKEQIQYAFHGKNIHYSIAAAEQTSFKARQFDLVTVAQALHWFNMSQFYREVKRTGKSGGLLAAWGYALLSVDEEVDELLKDFYSNKVGPYWDEARRLVENQYKDIPFPFAEIKCPEFFIRTYWTLRQFVGYLSSWSATQKFVRIRKQDPVASLTEKISHHWNDVDTKLVTFPIFMRLGIIP